MTDTSGAEAIPHLLVNTAELIAASEPEATGAIWNLPVRERDLDSNVIALPAGHRIEAHLGPDLDVMIHVLDGTGTLLTERDDVPLSAGALVWLPRRSRREIIAGPEGLRYLTVHQRRQALTLGPTR